MTDRCDDWSKSKQILRHVNTIHNNNNNTLIYIAPACRMTSEALMVHCCLYTLLYCYIKLLLHSTRYTVFCNTQYIIVCICCYTATSSYCYIVHATLYFVRHSSTLYFVYVAILLHQATACMSPLHPFTATRGVDFHRDLGSGPDHF